MEWFWRMSPVARGTDAGSECPLGLGVHQQAADVGVDRAQAGEDLVAIDIDVSPVPDDLIRQPGEIPQIGDAVAETAQGDGSGQAWKREQVDLVFDDQPSIRRDGLSGQCVQRDRAVFPRGSHALLNLFIQEPHQDQWLDVSQSISTIKMFFIGSDRMRRQHEVQK